MVRQNRSRVALGVFLILVGAFFLAGRFIPDLNAWLDLLSWPWIVIGVGVFLLVFGLLVGAPGMAVPAAIVSGIGGILYYQNVSGDWESWSFAWTLIPGFVGVGTLLAGLLGESPRQSVRHGINLILLSLVLFVVFVAIMGRGGILGIYWPALLIVLGVWFLIQAVVRRR
jgi:hypothetical protein